MNAKTVVFSALLLSSTAAFAQSAPTEFPSDAATLSADALKQAVSGKVLHAKLHDGSSWRLEVKSNGYIYVDTSRGFRDDGTWRTEEGKLCTAYKKIPTSCNEVRQKGDTLYLKRDNGEIVPMTAQ